MGEGSEQKVLPPSFEACLEELEKTVKELESGELPLEQALELYEKGVALAEACRKQLEEAETRVEILMKREGRLQPEPFRPERA
ncbi:MAG: exodeoxyribonuclease VII small subunit [Bryobacteraceae bacterium]